MSEQGDTPGAYQICLGICRQHGLLSVKVICLDLQETLITLVSAFSSYLLGCQQQSAASRGGSVGRAGEKGVGVGVVEGGRVRRVGEMGRGVGVGLYGSMIGARETDAGVLGMSG